MLKVARQCQLIATGNKSAIWHHFGKRRPLCGNRLPLCGW